MQSDAHRVVAITLIPKGAAPTDFVSNDKRAQGAQPDSLMFRLQRQSAMAYDEQLLRQCARSPTHPTLGRSPAKDFGSNGDTAGPVVGMPLAEQGACCRKSRLF